MKVLLLTRCCIDDAHPHAAAAAAAEDIGPEDGPIIVAPLQQHALPATLRAAATAAASAATMERRDKPLAIA